MNNAFLSCLMAFTWMWAGCSLDATGKTACDADSDCLDGYECKGNVCTVRSHGSGPAGPSLQAPSKLAGAYDQNDYRLTWQDNSQTETGFAIERSIGDGLFRQYARIGTTSADVTQFVTRFYKDATYRFRVQAMADQTASDFSNELTVYAPKMTAGDASQRPSRPAVRSSVKQIATTGVTYVLVWDEADFRGEETDCGYNVYTRDIMYDDESWNPNPIQVLSREALSCEVTLDFATEYAVAAFNRFGESEYGVILVDPVDIDSTK